MKKFDVKIERLLGQCLKKYRILKGVDSYKLSKLIGVSYQQLLKYETGENRISATKLHLVAKFLDVPIQAFFEHNYFQNIQNIYQFSAVADEQYLHKEQDLEVLKNYEAIKNKQIKKYLAEFINHLSKLNNLNPINNAI